MMSLLELPFPNPWPRWPVQMIDLGDSTGDDGWDVPSGLMAIATDLVVFGSDLPGNEVRLSSFLSEAVIAHFTFGSGNDDFEWQGEQAIYYGDGFRVTSTTSGLTVRLFGYVSPIFTTV